VNRDPAIGPSAAAAAGVRLAHRGDHRRHPENSIAALLAAIALPEIDGVEFDVRFSADGEPILQHDETLERVRGVAVAAATLSAGELARFGVPSLADVLAAMPVDAVLDIELKEAPNERFAAVLRAALGERPDQAVISSFEIDALAVSRVLLPEWPRWLNAMQLDRGTLATAARLGCRGVAVDHGSLGVSAVAGGHAAGLVVAAWTLASAAEERRMVELGVDVAIVEGAALDHEPGGTGQARAGRDTARHRGRVAATE